MLRPTLNSGNHRGTKAQRRQISRLSPVSLYLCGESVWYNCLIIRAMFEGVLAMAFTVEAVYENGVLKPSEPLPLEEHEKVTVSHLEDAKSAKGRRNQQDEGSTCSWPSASLRSVTAREALKRL